MNELASWRKSSYSGPQGNCVEVGIAPTGIGVRDTKNPHHTLNFNHSTWANFVATIKTQDR